jgi:hypothetical protein
VPSPRPSRKVKRFAVRDKVANKLITKVELRLDDVDWPIVITHNVLIDIEAMTGINVLTGEVNILRPSATLLRGVLFVALKNAGASYTLAQVGDLITPKNFAMIQKAILTAWVAAMPKEEATELERPMKAAG